MNIRTAFAVSALSLLLAAPFAQAQDPDAATTASEPAAQVEPSDAATPAAAAPATEAKQVTWADLDADGNGQLSKTEAEGVPSLKQVFDTADSNADGNLTAEEYKAHVAKSGAAPAATKPQG